MGGTGAGRDANGLEELRAGSRVLDRPRRPWYGPSGRFSGGHEQHAGCRRYRLKLRGEVRAGEVCEVLVEHEHVGLAEPRFLDDG